MFKDWTRAYKFKRLLPRDSQDGESEAEEQLFAEKALFLNRTRASKTTNLLSGIIGGFLGVVCTIIFMWISRQYLSGKNAETKGCSYWCKYSPGSIFAWVLNLPEAYLCSSGA